jgi:hypothetical protein
MHGGFGVLSHLFPGLRLRRVDGEREEHLPSVTTMSESLPEAARSRPGALINFCSRTVGVTT